MSGIFSEETSDRLVFSIVNLTIEKVRADPHTILVLHPIKYKSC